jgi:hypothetical protein
MAQGDVDGDGRTTAGSHEHAPSLRRRPVLGEGNARSVLTDFSAAYSEPIDGFSLTTVDGTTQTL